MPGPYGYGPLNQEATFTIETDFIPKAQQLAKRWNRTLSAQRGRYAPEAVARIEVLLQEAIFEATPVGKQFELAGGGVIVHSPGTLQRSTRTGSYVDMRPVEGDGLFEQIVFVTDQPAESPRGQTYVEFVLGPPHAEPRDYITPAVESVLPQIQFEAELMLRQVVMSTASIVAFESNQVGRIPT